VVKGRRKFFLLPTKHRPSYKVITRLCHGPCREVGVISDRHGGILNAVREQMEGYPPIHHRWCTRHLAENLLRKGGVKDNFDRFMIACRQLEDKHFLEILEKVRTTSNAEGR
jgi:hypothetical protein